MRLVSSVNFKIVSNHNQQDNYLDRQAGFNLLYDRTSDKGMGKGGTGRKKYSIEDSSGTLEQKHQEPNQSGKTERESLDTMGVYDASKEL